MRTKELLRNILIKQLTEEKVTLKELNKMVDLKLLDLMRKEDILCIKGEEVKLTEKGRRALKIVMTGGVFDIIHPGHIYTLRKAKELGDVLVVVVARDKTVKKLRGKEPVNNECLRRELVGSLKFVDVAILGSEKDIFETVEKIRPDIIVLGYDQAHDENHLLLEGEKRRLNYKVVRLSTPYPHLKSTWLKSRNSMSSL